MSKKFIPWTAAIATCAASIAALRGNAAAFRSAIARRGVEGGGQHLDAVDRGEPPSGRGWVACGDLVDDRLRDEQVERFARCPPLHRDLLVRGADQVTARQRGQVAEHARFEVDARRHGKEA